MTDDHSPTDRPKPHISTLAAEPEWATVELIYDKAGRPAALDIVPFFGWAVAVFLHENGALRGTEALPIMADTCFIDFDRSMTFRDPSGRVIVPGNRTFEPGHEADYLRSVQEEWDRYAGSGKGTSH